MIEHETGLPKRAVDTLCHTLSSAEICHFDTHRELVWVKNMMRYQGKGEKNLRSAAYHISEDLHSSPLITEFLVLYPEVKPFVPHRVSDTVSEFGPPDSRSLIPVPEQEQDKNSIPTPKNEMKEICGKFSNVHLWPKEQDELIVHFGRAGASDRIEKLSEYKESKGKKYRSDYATILNWERRNGHDTKRSQPNHIKEPVIPSLSAAWREQYGSGEATEEEKRQIAEYRKQKK